VVAVALTGCAGEAEVHRPPGVGSRLTFGDRGPSVETAALRAGAALARRFAHAYARAAYRRRPPSLPGESSAVARTLRAAGLVVPPARRHLRPRLAGLRIFPLAPGVLRASAEVTDRRDPPFTIGFVLRRRGGRWLITTVSAPN
jgi:hypothetical protein